MTLETPKTWTELAALAMILTSALAGVTWGLKLESRIDITNATMVEIVLQHKQLQSILDRGILPITEERLKSLSIRIELIQREIDEAKTDRNRAEAKIDTVLQALEVRRKP